MSYCQLVQQHHAMGMTAPATAPGWHQRSNLHCTYSLVKQGLCSRAVPARRLQCRCSLLDCAAVELSTGAYRCTALN